MAAKDLNAKMLEETMEFTFTPPNVIAASLFIKVAFTSEPPIMLSSTTTCTVT
jgi:hypothetical protein